MPSSRGSTPASPSSPTSPPQLTPNSKVKALLASLDNDSDDETVSGSARARLISTMAKKPISDPASPVADADKADRNVSLHEREKDSSADDDDDDEDIVRPRGRMAARMQAAEDDSEPEAEKPAESARERVKKMLMMKSKSPEPAANPESSDENDAPIASRKRRVRVPRRSTPVSSPRRTSASPGLFVSPSKPADASRDASDSEEFPLNPLQDDRFKALVEKKRQERLEREAREAAQKAKKMAERKRQATMLEEDDDMSDDNVERRLTQQAKPTRKASKKALEEIARKTQRMSRDMQLAHDPRTKKKITKEDLFKRFNYRPAGGMKEENTESTQPGSSSPPPNSDVEMHDTPPTSPASHASEIEKTSTAINAPAISNESAEMEVDGDLPTLEEALTSSPPRKLDKGKAKAVDEPLPETELPERKPQFKQRPIRIRPPVITDRKASTLDDSDSDLEILTAKSPDARMKRLDTIFDRVPARQANEPHSLQALKMLAHLKSPGKQTLGKNKKPSMTTTELQLSLQQRARQQAAREREERLEALRAKGVIVQTAEERERAMAEVEDLIAKARREAEELREKEKAAAKRERKAKGEVDPLGDSSDDEDWEETKEKPEELSLSGSEDEEEGANDASGEEEEDDEEDEEEDEMELDGEEEAETTAPNPIFDNEADETDNDEAEAQLSIDEDMPGTGDLEDDQEEELPVNRKSRRSRKSNVISDDENEEKPVVETPSASRTNSLMPTRTSSPTAPTSVLRSATKTFIPGLPVTGPVGLSLTQIFAGTMDDSQIEPSQGSPTASKSIDPHVDAENDPMAFLRRLPAPDLPPFVPTMEEDSQDVVMDSQREVSHVPESQPMETQTQGIQLGFSQSQVHGFDSLIDPMATQVSEFPEATQDRGFQHLTPIKGRFVEAPPSTIDTVVIGPESVPEAVAETPVVKKKGKLRRRAQVAAFSDEEDAEEPAEVEEQEDEFEITANVFDVMRKAARKKEPVVDNFDKKTSKAKEMIQEQAEESEDEYAGLGGASDDESGDEEDEYVKAMIDDEGGKDVDERKIAAFFA